MRSCCSCVSGSGYALIGVMLLLLSVAHRASGYRLPATKLFRGVRAGPSATAVTKLSASASGSTARNVATELPRKFHHLDKLLVNNPDLKGSQFLFVGGKGGVGKTSSSSAIAIALAEAGLRTLIVSTDPAHSLGDAIDVDLSKGLVTPVYDQSNLWALEIDIQKSFDELKSSFRGLDADGLANSLGLPKEMVNSLGLDDIASIFTNPPPGIDEIVALTTIFKHSTTVDARGLPRFDRIVIDTAPTGHTIRLLQLPVFLNSVTGKLIKLRSKVSSAVATVRSFFSGDRDPPSTTPLSNILEKLEALQENLGTLKAALEDPRRTQFAVVTIPTSLAVAESERLVSSLKKEKIFLSSVICNQIISPSYGRKYLETRRKFQRSWADAIHKLAKPLNIEVTEAPYVDAEVTGIHGLRYFSDKAHPLQPNRASNPMSSRKLTIFGGKGGVGKTSSAASWTVRLSDSGLKTLVVSTDPAHSLGDSFQTTLDGKPRLLDSSSEGGEVWAMEIDPKLGLAEFQALVKKPALASSASSSSSNISPAMDLFGGLGQAHKSIKDDLMNMITGVDDPPPGTDEIVALTKVIDYLEHGVRLNDGSVVRFDRIVLDTAPTGHTLRMLELPKFIRKLIHKVKTVSKKSGDLMGGFMGLMGGDQSNGAADADSESSLRLDKFDEKMQKLDEILHNNRQTDFVVVTIPTELAIAESKRLLTSLSSSGIPVRRIIVNQMLADGEAVVGDNAADAYLGRLRIGQQASIQHLEKLAERAGVDLIKVPFFDAEVRTVYGLRLIGNIILPK